MEIRIVNSSSEHLVYDVSDCSLEELDNRINLFFSSQGYRLKSTDGDLRIYEKGNRTMRMILGAFSTFHKQRLLIKKNGSQYNVMLQKDSSGMSGGLIGMNQVKKEFKRLTEAFQLYFKN